MKVFKEGDSEYISNGHYLIDGVNYMSVWTYKNKNRIEPNTTRINGSEGIQLSARNITIYESEPDYGNFGKILLYPEAVLEEFYK